eukprot:2793457-Pleurochrysis_carterae.AAC.3
MADSFDVTLGHVRVGLPPPQTDSLESQVSHLVQPTLKFYVTKFGFSATKFWNFKSSSQQPPVFDLWRCQKIVF